jgi:hypothetical protein
VNAGQRRRRWPTHFRYVDFSIGAALGGLGNVGEDNSGDRSKARDR